MNKVSLDSQIIIWGIKKQSTPDRIHKIDQAINFLDELEQSGAKIFLSSVVLGEILCDIPQPDRNHLIKDIYKRFMVIPFDASSALNYADIFFEKKIANNSSSKIDLIGRKHIKPDIMILASSVSAGMSVLFSEDDNLLKISEGVIPAYRMDNTIHQLSLLDSTAPAEGEVDD